MPVSLIQAATWVPISRARSHVELMTLASSRPPREGDYVVLDTLPIGLIRESKKDDLALLM